ncbi:9146_t:CDS:2 [Funneliformis geosporum]|uniref:General transcription and DNA repair factor IIH n=1 Tax=Funneliformis geosporum TaxID=1117311 RepID=A0A9W4SKU2_9GLOM|nr:9146_t:CDS:2 [Funneliformis geosporum]CAI2172285.1 1105_t:CDS:2 [Funneliformis geosporum]
MSKQHKQKNLTEEFIDVDDEIQTNTQQTGYAWEEEYKRSWDVLQEDEDGSLKRTVENLQQRKRKRLFRDTATIRRGIIRHMFLIIDLSEAMMEKDLRPSRLDLTLSYAEQFILEYFDQNPISQLAIIVTKGGYAEKISDLTGNPMDNIRALKNKKNTDTDGEPSLQNSLEMARSTLIHVPSHGSREILIIMGSLTTCDPGDIYDTIDNLVNENIRVSVVGLAAEVQICKLMCKKTKGTYGVVLNEAHFKDLLFEIIPPPPVSNTQNKAELVIMGFPSSVSDSSPSLCACHSKPTIGGYICARCHSKICDLPTDCPVCELTLVSSPHLARSYHHLFPINNFVEVPWNNNSVSPTHCFSCQIPFPSFLGVRGGAVPIETSGRYKCNRCQQHFCIDCDVFVHEVIHNCPGCLAAIH